MTPGECAAQLETAAGRAALIVPALQEFAVWMRTSVKDNFKAQGRPAPWIPTKYPPANHKATLVNDAHLLDSTTAFTEFGTDVVLAAGGGGQNPGKAPSLQYGANLNMRRNRGIGHFATKRSRKDVSRGGQHVIGYGVLPARPYLLFQPEDLVFFGVLLPEFIFSQKANQGSKPVKAFYV